MSDSLTKDECLRRLAEIYHNGVEPGWEQIKVRLTVAAEEGLSIGLTAYAFYPGQAPTTFTPPIQYDEDGDLASVDESDLFLALWELDRQNEPWYAATLTFFPDGQFSFVAVPGPEMSYEVATAFQDQP